MNHDSKLYYNQYIEDVNCYLHFDKTYNIDTATKTYIGKDYDGNVKMVPSLEKNNEKYPYSMGYQNTPFVQIDRINEILLKTPEIDSYKFVDVGSGKGRVILYNLSQNASYARYEGIEIDSMLHIKALTNIKNTNLNINKDVELMNVNILNYKPENVPTVYFLFYPFESNIYKKFLEKNKDIFNSNKTIIVYVQANYDLGLEESIGLKKFYEENFIYFYKSKLVILDSNQEPLD